MGSKRCGKCNKKVDLKYRYCPYCGSELKFTEEEKHWKLVLEDRQKKKQYIKDKIINFLIRVVVWLLLIFLSVITFMMIQSLGKPMI